MADTFGKVLEAAGLSGMAQSAGGAAPQPTDEELQSAIAGNAQPNDTSEQQRKAEAEDNTPASPEPEEKDDFSAVEHDLKQQNMQIAAAHPGIHPPKEVDLTPPHMHEAPETHIPEQKHNEPSFMDHFTEGAGHFGQGALKGIIGAADNARSLLEGLTGHEGAPEKDWQTQYEENGLLGMPAPSHETTQSGAYKAGELTGGIGAGVGTALGAAGLAAAAAPAVPEVAGAAALSGMVGADFLGGAGNAAHEDLKKTGHANAMHMLEGANQAADFGLATNVAGELVGQGLKAGKNALEGAVEKYVTNPNAQKENLKRLGLPNREDAGDALDKARQGIKAVNEAKNRAGDLIDQMRQQIKEKEEEIANDLRAHAAESLENLAKIFGPAPPKSSYELEQREAMANIEKAFKKLEKDPNDMAAIRSLLNNGYTGIVAIEHDLAERIARNAEEKLKDFFTKRAAEATEEEFEAAAREHTKLVAQAIKDADAEGKAAEEAAQHAEDIAEKAVQKLKDRFGKKAFEAQQAIADKAAKEVEKAAREGAEEGAEEALEEAAEEGADGIFRLRTHFDEGAIKLGYDIIQHATPMSALHKILPSAGYKKFKDASATLAKSKAVVYHLENQVKAYGENAWKLAKTAVQKVRMEEQTVRTERLTHEAEQKLAQVRAHLDLKARELSAGQKAALMAERAELLKKIKDSKGAKSDKKKQFFLRLAKIEEELSKIKLPNDLMDMTRKKHIEGIANREDIHHPASLNAATTFAKAEKQMQDAVTKLAAARKQYDDLREHFLPLFEETEQAFQKHIGDDERRLWVLNAIKHPHADENPDVRKLNGQMAIGLKFNPYNSRMHRMLNDDYVAARSELYAQDENVVKEVTYKHLAPLKMSSKDAVHELRKHGLSNPIAESIAMAILVGSLSLDAPAEAMNAHEKREKRENQGWGRIGLGLAAAILAGKYGVPAAKQIFKSRQMYTNRIFGNVLDDLTTADKVLPGEGQLAQHVINLSKQIFAAAQEAPDDYVWLVRAAKGEVDQKLISPEGKAFVLSIQKEGEALRDYVREYRGAFNRHYYALPQNQQEQLSGPHQAVNFVYSVLHTAPNHNLLDAISGKAFTNGARAWFGYNPTNYLGAVADLAITLPGKVGCAAATRGANHYAMDPSIRNAANEWVMHGPRADVIGNVAANSALEGRASANPLIGAISVAQKDIAKLSAPINSEALQGHVGMVASLCRYYSEHPRIMRENNINSEKSFILSALQNKLPEDVQSDVLSKMVVDLSETFGIADPLGLMSSGLIGRSAVGNYLKFASQPERFARLLVGNAMRGDWKTVAAMMGMMWQLGGHAVVPTSLRWMGHLTFPQHTASLMALLDFFSVGQRTVGNLSRVLDWDPFFYPATASVMPGITALVDLVKNAPTAQEDLGASLKQAEEATQGGEHANHVLNTLTGSPRYEARAKAQKSFANVFGDMEILYPSVVGYPTRMIKSQIKYGPLIGQNMTYVGVPSPMFASAMPYQAEELRSYPGAQETSTRRALNLPDPAQMSVYQDLAQGARGSEIDKEPVLKATKDFIENFPGIGVKLPPEHKVKQIKEH